MLYRSSTDAAQVAEKLEQEFKGQRFSAVQCDVTDQERVGVVFEQVIEGFGGRLDGLVAVRTLLAFEACSYDLRVNAYTVKRGRHVDVDLERGGGYRQGRSGSRRRRV